ncbi:hypothetical protein AB0M58_24360 [Streptomyces bobili]|uniref:hypothetical protein n=1 Tax=Streptomyces bobili TaxID=67280 RepID=UPI00342E5701
MEAFQLPQAGASRWPGRIAAMPGSNQRGHQHEQAGALLRVSGMGDGGRVRGYFRIGTRETGPPQQLLWRVEVSPLSAFQITG